MSSVEKRQFIGAKWGKYIRAPQIFFTILEKCSDLIELGEITDIKRGFTTGANQFFYLTEEELKKWELEKEYWMHKKNGQWIPNYVVKSPRDIKTTAISPKDVKYRVLMIHRDKTDLKGTNILKYITWGEGNEFNERPTCKSRKRWYDLGEGITAKICWVKSVNEAHFTPYSEKELFIDQRLYAIIAKKEKDTEIIAALLNSIFTFMFKEIDGRVNLGEGALDTAVYEIPNYPIPNPTNISAAQRKEIVKGLCILSDQRVKSVFEEILGKKITKRELKDKSIEKIVEDVQLNNVNKYRLEFDRKIGELLGLDETDLLELYRAVVNLVGARIKRALSVPRKKKTISGLDIEALVNGVLDEVSDKWKNFPEDFIGNNEFDKITVPKGKSTINRDLYGIYVKIGDEKIECDSISIARYIHYSAFNKKTEIKIPKNETLITKAVNDYRIILEDASEKIDKFVESVTLNKKIRARIKKEVWKRLGCLYSMKTPKVKQDDSTSNTGQKINQ